MLVELKNGETLNGHLVNCDTWMNLTLKEVVQTSPEGDKFVRLAEVYVRGNNVRSLQGHILAKSGGANGAADQIPESARRDRRAGQGAAAASASARRAERARPRAPRRWREGRAWTWSGTRWQGTWEGRSWRGLMDSEGLRSLSHPEASVQADGDVPRRKGKHLVMNYCVSTDYQRPVHGHKHDQRRRRNRHKA